MFSLEILYRKLCFFCPRGLSYYLRSFYSCVLTTEVYGDSREEEEEQEGGEDAASAAILPPSFLVKRMSLSEDRIELGVPARLNLRVLTVLTEIYGQKHIRIFDWFHRVILIVAPHREPQIRCSIK